MGGGIGGVFVQDSADWGLSSGEVEPPVPLCSQRVRYKHQGHHWSGVPDPVGGNRWQTSEGPDLGHCWPRALQGRHLRLLQRRRRCTPCLRHYSPDYL